MTKQEAIQHSRTTGEAITHRWFSDHEYIVIEGNRVFTEEGYSTWMNEFFSYRTEASWENDWSVKDVTPLHVQREEEREIKRRKTYTSTEVRNTYGGLTKFNRR